MSVDPNIERAAAVVGAALDPADDEWYVLARRLGEEDERGTLTSVAAFAARLLEVVAAYEHRDARELLQEYARRAQLDA